MILSTPLKQLLSTCIGLALYLSLASPLHAAPMRLPESIPEAPGQAALQAILNTIAKQRAEIINIQRELVSRPAIGPEAGGAGEEAKAAWVMTLLEERGIRNFERMDSVERTGSIDPDAKTRDVRPNIIVRYEGAEGLDNGRTFWIICHMHVAAPGPLELWSGSPWKLRVEGDTLYGRGVMDNYQSTAAALLLFESLAKNNITPPMNLGLILHSQNSGFQYLLENRPELFKQDDLYLVPDYGNPQGTAYGVAEKGLLWLKITVKGKQGHASASTGGASALMAGSRLIASLSELNGQFPQSDPLFTPPVSTFAPTRAFTQEDGINAIAAEYTLYLDSRIVPPYTPEDVERGVRALADKVGKESGTYCSIERLLAYPALPPTSIQSPVAQALMRAVKAQLPQADMHQAEGVSTTTSASLLRAKGLSVVTWAKMNPAVRQLPNESARISDHLDEAKVFARILFDPEAAFSAK